MRSAPQGGMKLQIGPLMTLLELEFCTSVLPTGVQPTLIMCLFSVSVWFIYLNQKGEAHVCIPDYTPATQTEVSPTRTRAERPPGGTVLPTSARQDKLEQKWSLSKLVGDFADALSTVPIRMRLD